MTGPTRITGDWLDRAATRQTLAALSADGHRVLFVGGCVRNAVLGLPVADVDLATDARPETVTALAERAGLRVVPTGIDHGTVTVVAGGVPHEVTTFRKDVETDGRRAVVAYSTDLTDDARRRDFTMNALYAEPDGRILDPLRGMTDLLARRVRFVGEAGDRIREDVLRILRFFRFHAWYGDPGAGLDAEGLAACAQNLASIETLSRERVGAEMRKLLSAPDPAPALAAMAASGVLAAVLPGADARAIAPLVHWEAAFGLTANPNRRLAALGAGDWSAALRSSRVDLRALDQLRAGLAADAGPAELGYRFGADMALSICLLKAAMTDHAPQDGTTESVRFGAAQVFPVTAADLMPGLSGPALGARLAALEARWIASGFRLGKADLLA